MEGIYSIYRIYDARDGTSTNIYAVSWCACTIQNVQDSHFTDWLTKFVACSFHQLKY